MVTSSSPRFFLVRDRGRRDGRGRVTTAVRTLRRSTRSEKTRKRMFRTMAHEMLATKPPTSFWEVSSTSPVAASVQSSLFSFCATTMPQTRKRKARKALNIQPHQRDLR